MVPEERICRVHLPRSRHRRPPAPKDDDTPVTDGNKNSLRCTLCHTVITKQELALSVQGSHEHAFFNPAGIAFEIRCFRAAPGTVLQGGTSDVFSWFSGYHWQVALCAHCRTHLGWRFTGDTVFFGLIAARIR